MKMHPSPFPTEFKMTFKHSWTRDSNPCTSKHQISMYSTTCASTTKEFNPKFLRIAIIGSITYRNSLVDPAERSFSLLLSYRYAESSLNILLTTAQEGIYSNWKGLGRELEACKENLWNWIWNLRRILERIEKEEELWSIKENEKKKKERLK